MSAPAISPAGDGGTTEKSARLLHPEEVELVRLLRRRDPRATTAVVRKCHRNLVRQAYLVLRNEAVAEDVVQDAWLAAFRRIGGFRGQSSLYRWLLRIVLNKAMSQRRRELRSSPLSSLRRVVSRRFCPGDEESEPADAAFHEITPERLLLEKEAIRRFDRALHALPQAQRSVVILKDLHGASSIETCRVLEINDLTQRVRLSRARTSIRLTLETEAPLAA